MNTKNNTINYTKASKLNRARALTLPVAPKNENVAELKGILSESVRQGKRRVIIQIPRYLLTIDERYQIPERTERSMNYLVRNWDERKLLPLTGVPHFEEGLIYLVDGYGRLVASDPEKYPYLDCMILLDAPKDPIERLKYEAELYAYQNANVARLRPIQKHGAFECMNDETAMLIDRMKDKYNFALSTHTQGKKNVGVIGSYAELYEIAKRHGEECLEYIFEVSAKAGFNRKVNGYSIYIMRMLKDIWKLYNNNVNETREFLGTYLRDYEPVKIRAAAVTKYNMLDQKSACSMYIEDIVVDKLKLDRKREIVGSTIVTKPASNF